MRNACASPNTELTTRIDLLRAGQVVAERLFEHDAHIRSVQPDRAELLADLREQVRAGRQIQHGGIGIALVESSGASPA